jgi:HAD superfamily hydrolase (TIGR01458 family)
VTNTTSRSRGAIVDGLREMGFEVEPGEVLTPAALAVAHCRERGYGKVALMVGEPLAGDLAALDAAGEDEPADAVVLGDLGAGFDATTLNAAFRRLMDGADLVALQHNRYWRRADGMALDVGAWSAALEYGAGVEATVVGKPSPVFFRSALADLGAEAGNAVMVGDDIEGDVGGGLGAGIASVLVRTGKYRAEAVAAAGVEPTATIDSIADLPGLLGPRE